MIRADKTWELDVAAKGGGQGKGKACGEKGKNASRRRERSTDAKRKWHQETKEFHQWNCATPNKKKQFHSCSFKEKKGSLAAEGEGLTVSRRQLREMKRKLKVIMRKGRGSTTAAGMGPTRRLRGGCGRSW